ncbi:MAG: hypothetical protein NTW01_07725 [Gammaproteobacteria bacterium]|jgi:hypothetical protein|nr:hypothetical protein [Gammaproteobacteria bacterium]
MTPETSSFPLKTRTYIELTRKAIDGNRCDRVPAVYLVSGSTPSTCDSVIYELDTEAARAYSFRTRDPVTGVSERARKYAGQLVVKRISDSAVEVRLACDSSAVFEPQEFALNFTVNGDIAAPPLVFDPPIGAKGGPRV